jgi:hypothetical protein
MNENGVSSHSWPFWIAGERERERERERVLLTTTHEIELIIVPSTKIQIINKQTNKKLNT